jgi:hypothetical protein
LQPDEGRITSPKLLEERQTTELISILGRFISLSLSILGRFVSLDLSILTRDVDVVAPPASELSRFKISRTSFVSVQRGDPLGCIPFNTARAFKASYDSILFIAETARLRSLCFSWRNSISLSISLVSPQDEEEEEAQGAG